MSGRPGPGDLFVGSFLLPFGAARRDRGDGV